MATKMNVIFDKMKTQTVNHKQKSGYNMKADHKSFKRSDGIERSRNIGRIEKYSSKFGRPFPHHMRHTFSNVVRCSTKSNSEERKLSISNLHGGVTELDILLLFGEFKSLRCCKIHYDNNGWPLGSAEVIFSNKIDAFQAIDLYNGLKLDGRILNIEIIIPEKQPLSTSSPSGSELSSELNSAHEFEESENFYEQQALMKELDILFEEFVKSRASRYKPR